MHEPVGDRDRPAIAAAVLVPLVQTADGWQLLFIRRAVNPDDAHSGQVAFPGGRRESADADLEATALREAHEEIGLADQHVTLIGRLPELISTTRYHITPFVGLMRWPYPLRLARNEVARAFTMPLSWLADERNREVYHYATPSGVIPVIRFRAYDGELLWGATARITVSLLRALDYSDRR